MPIEMWVTHSLDKLFPESVKPAGAAQEIALKAARNETEDAQVALQIPNGLEIPKASFSLPDLTGPKGKIPRKHLSASWVWYVYVLNNPPANRDPSSYLRKAPAFFPDGFLEAKTVFLRDGWTQSLWVSITVPKGTPAGEYKGVVGIDLVDRKNEKHHFDAPVTLTVWPFTLPDKLHLHHTDWFWPLTLASYYHLEPWSAPHWEWIEKAAIDLARHHNDIILTPLVDLVGRTKTASGFRYNFTRLNRWVKLFRKHGVDWIEGAHVAGRGGGWESDFVWRRFGVNDASGKPIDTSRDKMTEAEFEPYMESFLKAIHAHIKKMGWADKYVQHVADEPIPANEKSWMRLAGKVRAWLPGVPTIDAVETDSLEGYVDWRVPQIQKITPERKRHPKEDLWSYTCLVPQGQYPNRFLDYPSIRNRILFWLSWSYDLKGFLHWGYNSWRAWQGVPSPIDISPWQDASAGSIYCADRNPLPAGDPHIVYPGKREICSSIRWEVVRKGFEDFEYLYLLERAAEGRKGDARTRSAAKRLLSRVRTEIAATPLQYTRDDGELLAVREQAGELLAKLIAE
jgi:hypothetical protein